MEKKQKSFFIFIAILIGIIIGVLVWNLFTPKLAKGVFYYRIDGDNAKLFLITSKDNGKEIVSLPAREVDIGKYKAPNHSYLSNNGKQMIYFKKVGEEPIENFGGDENIVISRVISKPVLVNLKTGKKTEINQPIDSSSLVFSSNDNQIAWIKEVDEATFQGIEQGGKKRELWTSRADGESAKLLADFDENVVLLKTWDGDYIYFHGLWDVTIRSLGRVNAKNGKIEYLVPRYCEKFLENCKNIEFSLSGRYFIYEIFNKINGRDITEVYLGDFEKREFINLLTTDRISDRAWLDGEGFIYTEQQLVKKGDGTSEREIRETIHLVNIKNETDDEIYVGSYISQLTLDPNGKYLYFLEKERDGDNFELARLKLKTKEKEVILIENYNYILLSGDF